MKENKGKGLGSFPFLLLVISGAVVIRTKFRKRLCWTRREPVHGGSDATSMSHTVQQSLFLNSALALGESNDLDCFPSFGWSARVAPAGL